MAKEVNNKKGKILSGVVVSNNMDKTAVVKVETYKKHTKYQKFIKKSKKYSVHDKENTTQIGDQVKIEETKPFSKTKKFQIIK